MGLAALGKLICIHSMGVDKNMFTFNIGHISKASNISNIFEINEPSIAHNKYAERWAERGYYDELVSDLAYMCWTAYRAHMEEVCAWAEDLLIGKGYEWQNVIEQAERIRFQIKRLVDDGLHANL